MAQSSVTIGPRYDANLLKTFIYNSLNKYYYIIFWPFPVSYAMYKILGIMKCIY